MYKEFIEDILSEYFRDFYFDNTEVFEDNNYIVILNKNIHFLVIKIHDIQTDLACITMTSGNEEDKPLRYKVILEKLLRSKFNF